MTPKRKGTENKTEEDKSVEKKMEEKKMEEKKTAEKESTEKKPAADTDLEIGGEASGKRRPIVRVMAILALAILLGLLVWLVICIATGSKYTMAVLFLVILYPILIYLFFWIKKVFSK